ncbi:MAG TPA: CsbD family protein [Bryobacteraceae bacterium]|nr:CsbD family protein [Bryobacteraceae bacterium]
MNWDQVEGKWKQMKGTVREKWSKLTDDDFEYIGGKKDQLIGRLQERYGYTKEQADREADEWHKAQFHNEPIPR